MSYGRRAGLYLLAKVLLIAAAWVLVILTWGC